MGNNHSEELIEQSTNRTEVVAVENNFVPPSTEVDVEENDEEVQPSSPPAPSAPHLDTAENEEEKSAPVDVDVEEEIVVYLEDDYITDYDEQETTKKNTASPLLYSTLMMNLSNKNLKNS